MKLHEVRLKAAARERYGNQSALIGHISKWDVENECLYFLTRKQPGAIGKDGTKVPFADIVGVYKELDDRPGAFDDTDQIRIARQHYLQYGGQYARPKSDVVD